MMDSSTLTIKMRFLRPRSNSRLPDAFRLPCHQGLGSKLLEELMALMAEIALRSLFGLGWLMKWFS